MWYQIYRREFLDHLQSIRFAMSVLLSVTLMAVNGIAFAGGDFSTRMDEYLEARQTTLDELEKQSEDLANLAIRGPRRLHKQPSPMAFYASGRDRFLPNVIRSGGWGYGDWGGVRIHGVWHYQHHFFAPRSQRLLVNDFVDLDWAFVVGFALSLTALLLTFDGICGERQSGTLHLLLSGAVPRAAVMGGKFAAAVTVVILSLAAGGLVNLLIIGLFGTVDMDAAFWGKTGAIAAACVLYLGFFVGLGLLVSSRFERPAASLVTLLFLWTVMTVLVPNTTGGVVSSLQGTLDDRNREDIGADALREEWGIDDLVDPNPGGPKPYAYLKKIADYLEASERYYRHSERLTLENQLASVELGRVLNRLTPFGTFQYALESLADTGLSRHYRMIEAANRYRTEFHGFVKAADALDPDSHHLLWLHDGMSRRPVHFDEVPKFTEDLSAKATVQSTVPDLLVLLLFCVGAFMAANLAFTRSEIV